MADISDLAVFDLSRFPVHLGLGAKVIRQPQFTGGMDWYNGYGERNGADGLEGRLVTIHSFAAPWDTWEMHPKGDELVLCLAGRITLHQEIDGKLHTATLEPHQAIVNAPGVWHTADASGPVTALFITAGMGTEIRPR
jgi:quercetin dioxygenase-like cupin family protein